MRKDYYKNKDKSLTTGFGMLVSSLFSAGAGLAIYFGLLHNQDPGLIDSVLLWLGVAIFLLVASYLLFSSIAIIIYNLILIKKGLSRPVKNTDSTMFINTEPLAGLLAFIMATIFTLTTILILQPMYEKGTVEQSMVYVFIGLSVVLFIYALFVAIYNFIKKKYN